MNIAQEYMHRHKLNVPVVKHVQHGSLFFKEPDRKQWGIIAIDWQSADIHPGKYSFNLLFPTHDSDHRHFKNSSFQIYWDEYESHFIKLQKQKTIFPSTEEEVYLAAWQIFCFICDTHMSRYATYDSFYKSLDPKLTIVDRYKNLMETLAFLEKHRVAYLSVWQDLVCRHIMHYAYDLAKTLK